MKFPWVSDERFIVVPRPRLTEREMLLAFNVAADNRLWLAVQQLLDDLIREANESAQKSVANHGICASCTGGAEFLSRLRDYMLENRAAANTMSAEQAAALAAAT